MGIPIGATITSCSFCGRHVKVVDGVAQACHRCKTAPVMPAPDQWSREFRAFLWQRFFTRQICAPANTSEYGWLKILRGAFTGVTLGQGASARIVRQAASNEDIYLIALVEWQKSQEAA